MYLAATCPAFSSELSRVTEQKKVGHLVLVREELPELIKLEAEKRLCGDGDIRIAAFSDIDFAGKHGEAWLLSTDKRIIVIGVSLDETTVLHDYELALLKDITSEGHVGNGFLNAVIDGKHVTLARYSSALLRKFGAVAKQLDALSKGEEPKPDPEAVPKRCPKCGFPMEEGSTSCANCVKRRQVIIRLVQYVKPQWKAALTIVVMLLAQKIFDLVPPKLVGILVDDVLRAGNSQLLKPLVLILAGASIMSTVLWVIHGRMGAWLGARITHSIRIGLCEHLERLSVSYFDKRQTGAVMAKVSQDTTELQRFLSDDIYFFISQTFMLVGILAMMLSLNWKLGLISLIPAPFSAVMTLYVMKGLRRVYGRYWHRRSRFSAILNDSLSGVRTVKAFAQEDREAERIAGRSRGLMVALAEADSTWAALVPSFIFVMSSGAFLVWWFGGLMVISDKITLGTLMAMLGYVGMLSQPLTIIVRLSDWMGRVFAAAERVFEIMDTPVEQPDSQNTISMPTVEGHVEFKHVTFGYDPHNPVLHDINIDVSPGEMIGLVGRSGAGKSTTINLICRFYIAQEGEILIDGVDIKDISLKDLRGQIGVVPQEPYLFAGTVAENIAYSKDNATVEEIIRAAKAANAHDFIVNFPDGYETQVGERGTGLSGGEKQRIAIARAILHDPKILILDEATSSIDTETEKQIQEALARLVRNRTTFAIAHRLSTLRNANRLIVLENGKLAETGTHDELIGKKGVYYKLVKLQRELSKIKGVEG